MMLLILILTIFLLISHETTVLLSKPRKSNSVIERYYLQKRLIEQKPKGTKRVLFVVHEFPKFIQQFILNQITGLIDHGYDIYIYANKKALAISPPEIEKYNLLEKTFYRTLPHDLTDVDIIYCHFGPDGYCGLELKKKYHLSGKVVTCFRGEDISSLLQPHSSGRCSKKRGPFEVPCYRSDMYQRLFQECDLFLPVCDSFKQKLLELGCEQEKILVRYSGIDCKQFSYRPPNQIHKEKPIQLLSICRLVEKKGIEYAIRAVAQLLPAYPGLEYTIIGDGKLKQPLHTLAQQLDIADRVHLVGWKSQEETKTYLRNSHIFVLPVIDANNGDAEGIPNALKEAMATGVPVVSTYHSGVPELITHRQSGLLVPQKDPDALSQAIGWIIEHQEELEDMTRSARTVMEEKFDVAPCNEKLTTLFDQLCS